MKNIYLILFLLPFMSCAQENAEYIFQHSIPVSTGKNICISEEDCFFFTIDANSFYETMSYSRRKHKNKQVIDSIALSGYSSTLNSFKLQKNNSYIILWKIEHEHFPAFNIYYFKNGKSLKIGEWGIYSVPTEYRDSYDYSIKDIRIFQNNNKIEFFLLKDGQYINYSENLYNNNSVPFNSGTLLFSFDTIDKTLSSIDT